MRQAHHGPAPGQFPQADATFDSHGTQHRQHQDGAAQHMGATDPARAGTAVASGTA